LAARLVVSDIAVLGRSA